MRRGVLHHSFNCRKKPGLAELLVSSRTINDHEISKLIQKTHVPYLYLMTCGTQLPNPSELLGSNRMIKLLEYLESNIYHQL